MKEKQSESLIYLNKHCPVFLCKFTLGSLRKDEFIPSRASIGFHSCAVTFSWKKRQLLFKKNKLCFLRVLQYASEQPQGLQQPSVVSCGIFLPKIFVQRKLQNMNGRYEPFVLPQGFSVNYSSNILDHFGFRFRKTVVWKSASRSFLSNPALKPCWPSKACLIGSSQVFCQ